MRAYVIPKQIRSIHRDKRGGLYVFQDEDETLDYEINWLAWLGDDTISSVEYKAQGVTLTSSSNTGGAITIWVKGTTGTVEFTLTTAAGRVKQETITFKEKIA